MPVQFTKSLQESIEKNLNAKLTATQLVGGGSINQTQKIQTTQGHFFIKYNSIPTALDMFQKEAKGLELLRSSYTYKIPKVIVIDEIEGIAYLILEFIEEGEGDTDVSEHLGIALAELHQQTALQFGLDHDNYIGKLTQSNTYWDAWADFYREERLLPQMLMARNSGRMTEKDVQYLENLCAELPNLCPVEHPALIHGDLWAGNYMVNYDGQPVLIDPAVSYGHREMDLAMSRLFGGFDATFYQAYEEVFPLEDGFEERLDIYQLYYLLVHVNLFGGAYVNSVQGILRRF